jgi:hypothetical protein
MDDSGAGCVGQFQTVEAHTKANALRMVRSLANWCERRGIVPKD